MKTIIGTFNSAIVYTDNVEETAAEQIQELCNQEFFKDSNIRIMPDTHAGMGCVIGTTMTITDKVVANLVGVDIGCGMLTVELGQIDLNLEKIDKYIHDYIPSGFNINQHPIANFKEEIQSLRCFRDLGKSSVEFNRAIGSLGGGNHFIEINIDDSGCKYLVVHSGSRNLGNRVANYYQNKAYDYHNGLNDEYEMARMNLISELKTQGKKQEIQKALVKLKDKYRKECNISKDLCYLEGKLMDDYLYDMEIIQQYAVLNRHGIATRIVGDLGLDLEGLNYFQTIHNYIDLENMILRKGAISAQKDEIVLIPINMRDGSLICRGKGNPDWNYSAPHGAGRLMSRTKAKELIKLEDFEESMKDVYTTSVSKTTIDESAFAYKPMQEILDNIQDTVEVLKIIKPIYNFKAGE